MGVWVDWKLEHRDTPHWLDKLCFSLAVAQLKSTALDIICIQVVKQLLDHGAAERINEANQFDQKFPLYYPLEMAVLSNSKDNPEVIQVWITMFNCINELICV